MKNVLTLLIVICLIFAIVICTMYHDMKIMKAECQELSALADEYKILSMPLSPNEYYSFQYNIDSLRNYFKNEDGVFAFEDNLPFDIANHCLIIQRQGNIQDALIQSIEEQEKTVKGRCIKVIVRDGECLWFYFSEYVYGIEKGTDERKVIMPLHVN